MDSADNNKSLQEQQPSAPDADADAVISNSNIIINAFVAPASTSSSSSPTSSSGNSNVPKLCLSDSDSGHESGSPTSSTASPSSTTTNLELPSQFLTQQQQGKDETKEAPPTAKLEKVPDDASTKKSKRVPASVFLEELSANDLAHLGLPTTFKNCDSVASSTSSSSKAFKVPPSKFACNVCNIVMTSESQLASHHQGIKHQRRLALMEGRVLLAPPPKKKRIQEIIKAPPSSRVVSVDLGGTSEEAAGIKTSCSREEPMSDGEVVSDDSDEKGEEEVRIEKDEDGRRYMVKVRQQQPETRGDLREKLRETKKYDRVTAPSPPPRRTSYHRSPSRERSGEDGWKRRRTSEESSLATSAKRSRSSRSPKPSRRTDKEPRRSPSASSSHRRRQRRSVSCSSSVSASSLDRSERREKTSRSSHHDQTSSRRDSRNSKLLLDEDLMRDVEKQLAAHRKSFDKKKPTAATDGKTRDFQPRARTAAAATAASRSRPDDDDHEMIVNKIRSPGKKKRSTSIESTSPRKREKGHEKAGRYAERDRDYEKSGHVAERRRRSISRDRGSGLSPHKRERDYEKPSRNTERRRSRDRSHISPPRKGSEKPTRDKERRSLSRERLPTYKAARRDADDRKVLSSNHDNGLRERFHQHTRHDSNSTDGRRDDKSPHCSRRTTPSRSPKPERRSHNRTPPPPRGVSRTSSSHSDRPMMTARGGYKDKMSRPYAGNKYIPLSQRIKDSMEPVVGLGYVSEWLACSRLMDPYYECDLCQTHGKVEVMMSHLLGKLHRENFLERKEKSFCRDKAWSLSKAQLMNLLDKYDDRDSGEGEERSLIETIYSDEQYPWPQTKSPWDVEMGGTGIVPNFARGNLRPRRKDYNRTDEQVEEERRLREERAELERISLPVVDNVKPNLVEEVTSKEEMRLYLSVLKSMLEKTSRFHLSRSDEKDDLDKLCTMARYGLEMSEKIDVREANLTEDIIKTEREDEMTPTTVRDSPIPRLISRDPRRQRR